MLLLINTLFLQLACNAPTNTSAPEDTASSSDTDSPVDTDSLGFAGELFELRESEGDTLIELLGIYFDADGEHLRFGGVCNEHSGSFEIIDGALHYTWVGSTELSCRMEDNAEESELIAFMQNTPSFEFDGDTITLGGQNATLYLDK